MDIKPINEVRKEEKLFLEKFDILLMKKLLVTATLLSCEHEAGGEGGIISYVQNHLLLYKLDLRESRRVPRTHFLEKISNFVGL